MRGPALVILLGVITLAAGCKVEWPGDTEPQSIEPKPKLYYDRVPAADEAPKR